MEIPDSMLIEFKCSQCDNFLNRGPVYLRHDSLALCCTCFTPETPATRNRCYESAARLLLFPCKNRENGCTVTIPFVDETQEVLHEDECSFSKYTCPIFGFSDCDWLGPKEEILIHCRKKHPKHVVKNPVTLLHNIRCSNVQSYLLLAFELLFLLQIKICTTSGKIFHMVRFLGDPAKAEEFTFTVDVKCKNISATKHGKVTPQGCLPIQESISVILNINKLMKVLKEYQNIPFTITLKQNKNTVVCIKCSTEIHQFIYYDKKGWWCENCAPEKRKCTNYSKGCIYEDIDDKLIKHEAFFCEFNKWCRICQNKNIPEESLTMHYKIKHQREAFEAGSIWRMNKREQCLFISCIAGIGMCWYKMDGSLCILGIRIPVPSDQLNEFLCKVTVSRFGTNESRTFTPNVTLHSTLFDWYVTIRKDEFPYKNGLNVSINITRTEKKEKCANLCNNGEGLVVCDK